MKQNRHERIVEIINANDIETQDELLEKLKEDGFEVALCPWDRKPDVTAAAVMTVAEEKLFGVMHTTWHTLSRRTPYVALCARYTYDGVSSVIAINPEYERCAALLRKVYFVDGDYEKTGWGRYEIGVDVT